MRTRDPSFIILLTLWFALAFGLAEVILDAVRKFYLGRIIGLGPDLVWMIPLADVIIFMVPGTLLALIARVRAGGSRPSVPVFVFASLGFFSLLLLVPIHMLAKALLAVGLAYQFSRLVSKYDDIFERLVRRSTPVLATLVALATIAVLGWQWNDERQAHAALPASDPGAPNVLLIVMDTVRAENMSLYGYERETTPSLESLAQDGVLFEHPISTAPWTLPSHASMFTGRWHHELSTDWGTSLDDTFPTLAEGLRGRGYLTAGFVANTFYGSYEHGLNRGFIHYEDFDRSLGQITVSSTIGQLLGCWKQLGPGCDLRPLIDNYEILGRKSAEEVNHDFLSWLESQGDGPFFAFLNYFDAHAPYLPPEPYATMFGPERPAGHPAFTETIEAWPGSDEDLRYELIAYDGAIAYLDHQIGSLVLELQRRGMWENTLLIVTSDHGEEFREHAVMSHGNTLYRQSVEVPLLLVFPSTIPGGERISEAVSLRNIPATVADLTGYQAHLQFPGISLAAYWEGDPSNPPGEDPVISEVSGNTSRPDWYPIVNGDMSSAVIGGIRYIRGGGGQEELFDFASDPLEMNALSPDDEMLSPLVAELRQFIDGIP